MSAPVWYLDVDGVINALHRGPVRAGYEVTTAVAHGMEFEIRYRPAVVDFINDVSRRGLAEVRWLTTWEGDARTSLAPVVGLDEFSAYRDDRDLPPGRWWKAEVVTQEFRRKGQQFLWTDDELVEECPAMFAPAAVPWCAICPDSHFGLDDAALEDITRFLARAEVAEAATILNTQGE